jgi:hypothetical protein
VTQAALATAFAIHRGTTIRHVGTTGLNPLARELAEDGGKTTLTLTQDNNATQAEADKMAEDNWGPMLLGLKETAEQ